MRYIHFECLFFSALFAFFLSSLVHGKADKSNAKPKPKCVSYTSVHGDNCFKIVTEFGLNRTYFRELNPKLSCRPLKEGTKLCVGRINAHGPDDEARALERFLSGDDEALDGLKGELQVEGGKKPGRQNTIGKFVAHQHYAKANAESRTAGSGT